MKLTLYQQKILNAEICPYCKSDTIVVTEEHIYGKRYKNRKVICCKNYPNCDAYVGCHEDETAMGRLADKRLRGYKNSAHRHFDKIWKEGLKERGELYEDLSIYLNLPKELTHIGMFQENTCKKVIYWASVQYTKLKSEQVKRNIINETKNYGSII